MKLKVEDLQEIAERMKPVTDLRNGVAPNEQDKGYRMDLMLCAGTGCVSNKSFDLKTAIEEELQKHNLQNEIRVVPTGCQGFCAQGPIILVKPDGIF